MRLQRRIILKREREQYEIVRQREIGLFTLLWRGGPRDMVLQWYDLDSPVVDLPPGLLLLVLQMHWP